MILRPFYDFCLIGSKSINRSCIDFQITFLIDQEDNVARATTLRTFSDQIFETTLAPISKENFGKQAAPAAFTIYGHFETGAQNLFFDLDCLAC